MEKKSQNDWFGDICRLFFLGVSSLLAMVFLHWWNKPMAEQFFFDYGQYFLLSGIAFGAYLLMREDA
jgi:hypothetical protein